MRFSIGQLIIGKPENGYHFTNEHHVCKVVDWEEDHHIGVKVIKGPELSSVENEVFSVLEYLFVSFDDTPFEGNV